MTNLTVSAETTASADLAGQNERLVMRGIMKLPKLYAPVKIIFSSLRNGLGANMGVIFDIDTDVTRKCRRVLCDGGWKWQLVDYYKDREWDWGLEQDKEILDEYGCGLEFEYAYDD